MDRGGRVCLEGPNVNLLTLRLLRITLAGLDERRAVVDVPNLEPGERQLAQLADVKPLVRGAAYGTLVQVECVNIDVGPHRTAPENAETAGRRPRTLPPKRQGGLVTKYTETWRGWQ